MLDFTVIFESDKLTVYESLYCGYLLQKIVKKNKSKTEFYQVRTLSNSHAWLWKVQETINCDYFFDNRGHIVLTFTDYPQAFRFCELYTLIT